MVDFKNVKPKKIYQKHRNGDSIRHKGRPPSGNPAIHHILITDSLKKWIDEIKRKDESNNDALERILRGKSFAYQDLRKKYDALEVELQRHRISRSNNSMEQEVNEPLQVIINAER